jgi:hypothetical protein
MLTSCGMLAVSHPLYSPFLVLLTFFLFLKVKTFVEGTRFQDIVNINNVMTKLNPVPLGAFDGSFVQYLESCMKCVPVKKDYFDGE